MGIYNEYLKIIDKELKMELNNTKKQFFPLLHDPQYFINVAQRLLEIAKNATVLRCGNKVGHLTDDTVAYESDSAHTNLANALADYALDFAYGLGANTPTYTRREIREAILLHDLPENETGDIPDNCTRDESQKQKAEMDYIDDFLKLYGENNTSFCDDIKKLLQEMQDKSTEEGRILYLADKAAAIIMMLGYDKLGKYPYACPGEKDISEVNMAEMKLCDEKYHKGYLLSELWTVDFLFARELVRYDDTGFFMAIIVMTTLYVRGKWYNWRENQYF